MVVTFPGKTGILATTPGAQVKKFLCIHGLTCVPCVEYFTGTRTFYNGKVLLSTCCDVLFLKIVTGLFLETSRLLTAFPGKR